MRAGAFLTILLLGTTLCAQEKPKAPLLSAADQKRVDEAIARGVAFLQGQSTLDPKGTHATELMLWTLVHAGVRAGNPKFDELFQKMIDDPMTHTYRVSLQAMILEELDRVKHQKRIYQCAQFLIDNQCKNGQWYYGEAIKPVDLPVEDVATGPKNFADAQPGDKPNVVKKLTIKRRRDGPDEGDNSNSQYAALGLRACQDAGIVLPREAILRARAWWRLSMQEEEVKGRPSVATGTEVSLPAAGWCYGGKTHGHKPYGTMTAGAVGSLAICSFMLGEKNPRKEIALLRGLEWMGREFTVSANPGPPEHSPDNTAWMTYYWLYAMERAGLLAGVETMGGHKWYAEGVQWLLAQQKGDGSWLGALPHADRPVELNAVWDTCFAILFLKRATKPLQDVASTDRFHQKK
jgi:hypothetical protein